MKHLRRLLTLVWCGVVISQPVWADYLSADLRSRVDELKQSVQTNPTNATTAPVRARLTWEWINAFARNGSYVPVNATQVVARVLANQVPAGHKALDATIAELAFFDDSPDALGTLSATEGPFEAGQFATIAQTYTVGEHAVQTGGAFLLARHFMANFGAWQNTDRRAANYVSISSSNPKVSFLATTTPWGGMHGGFRRMRETMTFKIASGTLNPGDTVTITWGDTRGGGPGLRMSTFATDRLPLPLYIALHDGGPFLSLPIQPIRVQGSELAGVAGFAPSVVGVGERFEFSIRGRDAYYNRATNDIPNWQVTFDSTTSLAVEAAGAISHATVVLDKPGIYRPSIR